MRTRESATGTHNNIPTGGRILQLGCSDCIVFVAAHPSMANNANNALAAQEYSHTGISKHEGFNRDSKKCHLAENSQDPTEPLLGCYKKWESIRQISKVVWHFMLKGLTRLQQSHKHRHHIPDRFRYRPFPFSKLLKTSSMLMIFRSF